MSTPQLIFVDNLKKLKQSELQEINQLLGCVDDVRQKAALENEKNLVENEIQQLTLAEQKLEAQQTPVQETLPEKSPVLKRQNAKRVETDIEVVENEEEEDDEEEADEEEEEVEETVEATVDDDGNVDTEKFMKGGKSLKKKKTKKTAKIKVPEIKREDDRMSLREVQTEIKNVVQEFGKELTDTLRPYQRKARNGNLFDRDVDDLIDAYNEIREDAKEAIDDLLAELGDGESLPKAFVRFVENGFARHEKRVKRIIK
jgi:hypothetical protein